MDEKLMTNEVVDDVVEVCEMPVEMNGNSVLGKVIVVAGVAVAAVVGSVLYARHKNKTKNENDEAEPKRKFQMFNLKDKDESDEDINEEDEQ